ncbi:putative cathepsin B5 cysteine protease [Monocercomonoides exilis]|uniref:putative cathepsin B5 cysteine protease n=1 Tax=Monocercomonoides exilis TaxID=2049356 RepID=UPI003559C60D|nr:putative cathepsin B5 cysteine protease [Monocercomonoides exilis]|eukprot:MONOS_776.1-p1 / transcript=MONOS_776.1 / gene=MONOS_776 / organism=Monocercomonoides_exilis_PA203 / gene_product=cathepsin B5 cysteine protease / transcript_product=cathepsin B5 cysteine protease / location=Mono_scaffold00013:75492-76340(+) / protein_length=282 / sequence_SO=supercontig / SO=protein_coding / is_pseudo=false
MMIYFLIFSAYCKNSIVQFVNNYPGATWKATEYPIEVIKQIDMKEQFAPHHASSFSDYIEDSSLPDTFDARIQWPGKMVPVRKQGSCGSCWAHSASESAGNRLNILGCSRGVLSVQDQVSCNSACFKCLGCPPPQTWKYIKQTGLATEKCIPYVSADKRIPQCPKKCVNGSDIVRVKATSYSHIPAKNMQQELYEHGPFQASFITYEDFRQYKSGVYKHLTGKLKGAHCVMVMGWGTENGIPYWLVQNTYGTEWGEDGFFKIIRGTNECEFETACYAGYFQC